MGLYGESRGSQKKKHGIGKNFKWRILHECELQKLTELIVSREKESVKII